MLPNKALQTDKVKLSLVVTPQMNRSFKGDAVTTAPVRKVTTFALCTVFFCALFYGVRSTSATNGASTLSAYRVETTTILDRDDTKCLKTRIESSVEFYATVDNGEGHTSVASNFDQGSELHFVEVVLLLDHVESRQCVKELLAVGAAGGPSVLPVTREYKLNDSFTTTDTDGTYERDQTVELLKWQGRAYTLSVVNIGITKP